MSRPISAGPEITQFLHCRKCIEEWKAGLAPGESPSSYSRVEVGYTKVGIQARCIRHNLNMIHIDFDGVKHRANTDGK